MLNPLMHLLRRVLRMSEQHGPSTSGTTGGGSGRTTDGHADERSSDDRIDDHARRILQSMHTSPSEVTIGMIRQTNGCSGLSH